MRTKRLSGKLSGQPFFLFASPRDHVFTFNFLFQYDKKGPAECRGAFHHCMLYLFLVGEGRFAGFADLGFLAFYLLLVENLYGFPLADGASAAAMGRRLD
jgi:hypothetical protein